jgi:hypothetical protein
VCCYVNPAYGGRGFGNWNTDWRREEEDERARKCVYQSWGQQRAVDDDELMLFSDYIIYPNYLFFSFFSREMEGRLRRQLRSGAEQTTKSFLGR